MFTVHYATLCHTGSSKDVAKQKSQQKEVRVFLRPRKDRKDAEGETETACSHEGNLKVNYHREGNFLKHFQVNSCHAIRVGGDTDVKMNDRLTGLLFYEMTADK